MWTVKYSIILKTQIPRFHIHFIDYHYWNWTWHLCEDISSNVLFHIMRCLGFRRFGSGGFAPSDSSPFIGPIYIDVKARRFPAKSNPYESDNYRESVK